MARYPQCQRVDSKLIEPWFNNLNWGPDKVAAERADPQNRQHGCTTEVSGCWSCIHEIYESVINRIRTEFPHADDITMLGGHPLIAIRTAPTCTSFYDYNVVDCKPEEEIDKYHNPLNKIICEETIRLGGSMVHHHGIGKHRVHWSNQHGSVGVAGRAEKQFDPNGIMNTGTIYPIENNVSGSVPR